jgi:hypothetical protein
MYIVCSSSIMRVSRPTHLIRYCGQIFLFFASLSLAVCTPLLCGCWQSVTKVCSLTQIRERSTRTISNFIGRQLTPTKYLNTEESRTPWNKFTTVQSPYIRGKLSYKTRVQRRIGVLLRVIRPGRPSINRSLPRLHHINIPYGSLYGVQSDNVQDTDVWM